MITCAEFKDLAAAYALGALDPDERQQAEAHLGKGGPHEGCLEALRRAHGSVELLGRSLLPARPDESLWKRIEQEISPVAIARPSMGSRGRERAAWAVAAAAVVAVFLLNGARLRERQELTGGTAAALARVQKSEQERLSCAKDLEAMRGQAESAKAAFALLQVSSTRVVSLAPPSPTPAPGVVDLPGSARALINVELKRAILLSAALSPHAGKDYELWLIRGDKKVPAGLLRAGGELASIDGQLLASGPPDAVAVTLEPEGGRAQPTGPIILVGLYPKT